MSETENTKRIPALPGGARIKRASSFFIQFTRSQQFSGFFLLCCTLFSLWAANSSFKELYLSFWSSKLSLGLGEKSIAAPLEFIVNDVFMAFFFLLVGLEIKRELRGGELGSLSKSLRPVAAAFGGMVVPALFYFLFNKGTPYEQGWGIPMATDIAFALGIVSLAGSRVPVSLKIFLTALAVVDDIGAIVVIAIFYTDAILLSALFKALIVCCALLFLHARKVNHLLPYLIGGSVLWIFLHESGIHATLSGVITALMVPINEQHKASPLHRLEHLLHQPVNYFVMPVFALCNTAISIPEGTLNRIPDTMLYGIVTGLVVGKTIGIFGSTWLVEKIFRLPAEKGNNRLQLLGISCLGGIGFTMSIFVSLLAFEGSVFLDHAKLAVLMGSGLAAVLGLFLLMLGSRSGRT